MDRTNLGKDSMMTLSMTFVKPPGLANPTTLSLYQYPIPLTLAFRQLRHHYKIPKGILVHQVTPMTCNCKIDIAMRWSYIPW